MRARQAPKAETQRHPGGTLGLNRIERNTKQNIPWFIRFLQGHIPYERHGPVSLASAYERWGHAKNKEWGRVGAGLTEKGAITGRRESKSKFNVWGGEGTH